LHRVWHRELPSSDPSSVPTSVRFCETTILVGRNNNTILDLVQITIDLAVLSTIKFTSPADLHYAQVCYDPVRSVLWVAPFSRGSVFAFSFALKGQPPIKDASAGKRGTIEAFSQVAEYPLDPVLSFVLGPTSMDQDPEMFFATPSGFSQATIGKASLPVVSAPEPSETATVPEPSAQPPAAPVVSAASARPVAPAVPAVPSPKQPAEKKLPKPISNQGSKVGSPVFKKENLPVDEKPASVPGPSADDVGKLLKKTEDRLSNNIKQQLSNHVSTFGTKVDALGKIDRTSEIAAIIKKEIQAALSQRESQSDKASTRLRADVSSAISSIKADVVSTRSDLAKQIATQAATFGGVTEQTRQSNETLAGLVRDVGEIRATQAQILQLLQATQKQQAEMLEEMRRVKQTPVANAPPPVQQSTPKQWEDIFLAALSTQSEEAILALLAQYWPHTEEVLPEPGHGKASPLSQAVLLTVVHRVSTSIGENSP
jgi:hypothetical protein